MSVRPAEKEGNIVYFVSIIYYHTTKIAFQYNVTPLELIGASTMLGGKK